VGDIFSSFGDIFEDFFGGQQQRGGGRRRGPSRRRGSDLRYVLEIDLDDVVTGIKKEIKFDSDKDCNTCSGTGAEGGAQPDTCNQCGGSGQVVRQQGFFQMASTCPGCQGKGQIIKNPCGSCRGTAREKVSRRIEANVPAGVSTGTQLRLTSEGDGGYKGGPDGDLYVEIKVRKHKKWQREGQHIYGEYEVSYLQAVLGAELEVEAFGETQKVNVSRGSQGGDVIKVSGFGLPSIRSARRGDLILQLKVVIPKKLSNKEEELLRQIAQDKDESGIKKKKGFFS